MRLRALLRLIGAVRLQRAVPLWRFNEHARASLCKALDSRKKETETVASKNGIYLVTTCFNNPAELERTVRSVALQAVKPEQHIVVDSSDSKNAARTSELANVAGARYIWTPPEGVYPAMNRAIDELPDEGLVWFVNSSDWLASPRSVEIAASHIQKEGPDAILWVVGVTLRALPRKLSFHKIGQTPGAFSNGVRCGSTGFPHPSSLIPVSFMKSVGGFDTSYTIAADYDLGLKAITNLGDPVLINYPLAVHVPGGISYRHPFRYFFEKAASRRKNLSLAALIKAHVVASLFGIRSTLRRWQLIGEPSLPKKHMKLLENADFHYCGQPNGEWPACCDEVLDGRNVNRK